MMDKACLSSCFTIRYFLGITRETGMQAVTAKRLAETTAAPRLSIPTQPEARNAAFRDESSRAPRFIINALSKNSAFVVHERQMNPPTIPQTFGFRYGSLRWRPGFEFLERVEDVIRAPRGSASIRLPSRNGRGPGWLLGR